MLDIIVFGTGSIAEYFLKIVDENKCNILAFTKSNVTEERFYDHPVVDVLEIKKLSYDYVVIASGYVLKIECLLRELGIDQERIVSFIYDEAETYRGIEATITDYLCARYHRDIMPLLLQDDIVLPKVFPSVMWEEELSLREVYKDYVREQTLALIADQINRKGVEGAIAELGVYRGDFTVVMEKVFPSRKMYLYDTFEGFSQIDVEKDSKIKNAKGEEEKFKDTSVDLVLQRLSPGADVTVKKGLFPNSFEEHAIHFAFVSVDLNLEDPVEKALELFYPRLSKGGWMLVSDYNAPLYKGSRVAVDRFCADNHLVPIPVADFYGSVLLSKS